MSSAHAIAAVSVVIRDLLVNGMIDHDVTPSLRDVTVSALPPDKVDISNTGKSQLNLFLYQVTPNLGWVNSYNPELDSRGRRISNPPLALDLHYLVSAYASQDFHGEILLGYAMQLLHEVPVLKRDAVRVALAAPGTVSSGGGLPDELRVLSASGLAEQFEQIKIVMAPQSTEEMSKLWAAFQASYRPTAAYHVSVVLIERDRSTLEALPVRERRIHVRQLLRPNIEKLEPQFVEAGGKLKLVGTNFGADSVGLKIGSTMISLNPDELSDTEIEFDLPIGLQAGLNTVQIVHGYRFDTPDDPHTGVQSSPAAFVLRPKAEIPAGSDLQIQSAGDLRSAEIPLRLTPSIGKSQRVMLFLNQVNPPANTTSQAYSFPGPTLAQDGPDSVTDLTVSVKNVLQGQYLFRVQVDGGESAVEPESGPPTGPIVDLA